MSRLRTAISRWRSRGDDGEVGLRGRDRHLPAGVLGRDPRDPHLVGGLVLGRPPRGVEEGVGQRRVEDRLGSRLGDVAVEPPRGVEDRGAHAPVEGGMKDGLRLVEKGLGAQDRLRRLSDRRVALGGALDRLLERHALPHRPAARGCRAAGELRLGHRPDRPRGSGPRPSRGESRSRMGPSFGDAGRLSSAPGAPCPEPGSGSPRRARG